MEKWNGDTSSNSRYAHLRKIGLSHTEAIERLDAEKRLEEFKSKIRIVTTEIPFVFNTQEDFDRYFLFFWKCPVHQIDINHIKLTYTVKFIYYQKVDA